MPTRLALDATVDRLRADGATVEGTLAADIRERDACASAVRTTMERFGSVDILVNAAGVIRAGRSLDISADDWQHVFGVNVLGTYFMMVEAIAAMRANGPAGGRIVNISSIDGFKAHPRTPTTRRRRRR